jgi:hypothetical protein
MARERPAYTVWGGAERPVLVVRVNMDAMFVFFIVPWRLSTPVAKRHLSMPNSEK